MPNGAAFRRSSRFWRRSRAPRPRCVQPIGTMMPPARSRAESVRMPAEPQTIGELARALGARAITSEAVTERSLAVIAERNPSLNAFIAVLADDALAQAREADREIAAGRSRGPLHGVPI